MKKLPKLSAPTVPDWQKERLAAWIREWRIDQELREVDQAGPSLGLDDSRELRSAAMKAVPTEPYRAVEELVAEIGAEKEMAPGQIRLLTPETTTEDPLPLYVAVLREWEEDSLLVVPFGRFSEPATTGELLTGRDARSLRVLCLWNAHTVPPATVARSWFIDNLSEEEAQQAWQVFRHVATGADLDEPLQLRIGPPILHAEDPRIEYQEEEVARMAAVVQYGAQATTATDIESDQSDPIVIPWIAGYEEEGELAMVAKSTSIYEGESLFRIAGKDLVLCVRPHSNWRDCVCLVIDESGEPSETLDGWTLKSARGEMSAPIQQSQAVVSSAILRDGFVLLDASGTTVELEPVN